MSFSLVERLPKINNKALLQQAFRTLNYHAVEHERPVVIRGFAEEIQSIRCEIVLSRDTTQLPYDVGFHQEADGSFTLVTDSFDNEKLGEFTVTLKRTYEEENTIAQARSLGYKVRSRGRWVQHENEEYLEIEVSR